MRLRALFCALVALGCAPLARAETPAIAVPHDNDDYSRLVARAEAGDAGVDFHALRFAWLDSAARLRAGPIDGLTADMVKAAGASNDALVRADAEKILSIDYTDLLAHKYRRQACQLLGDTGCANHEHFVEFGLLTSVTKGKDGQSKATAWEVATIDEEYFILAMAGLKPGLQALINDGGRAFDRFEVTDPGGAAHEVWFDVTVMLPKEIPGLK